MQKNSKNSDGFTNLQIKKSYKKIIEQEAYNLSAEFGERVTIASLLYILIEDHLDAAVKTKRNQMNFEGK